MGLVVALRENGRVADAETLVESLHAEFEVKEREDDALYWQVQHNRAYVMRNVGK